jgi:hypothetical protein
MRLPGDRTTGDHPETLQSTLLRKRSKPQPGSAGPWSASMGIPMQPMQLAQSSEGGSDGRTGIGRTSEDPAGSTDAVLFNSGGPIPGRCLNCGDPAHHRYGNPVEDEGQDHERVSTTPPKRRRAWAPRRGGASQGLPEDQQSGWPDGWWRRPGQPAGEQVPVSTATAVNPPSASGQRQGKKASASRSLGHQ